MILYTNKQLILYKFVKLINLEKGKTIQKFNDSLHKKNPQSGYEIFLSAKNFKIFNNYILNRHVTCTPQVLPMYYIVCPIYLVRVCVGILAVWGPRHQDLQTLHMVRGRHHYM